MLLTNARERGGGSVGDWLTKKSKQTPWTYLRYSTIAAAAAVITKGQQMGTVRSKTDAWTRFPCASIPQHLVLFLITGRLLSLSSDTCPALFLPLPQTVRLAGRRRKRKGQIQRQFKQVTTAARGCITKASRKIFTGLFLKLAKDKYRFYKKKRKASVF